MSYKFRMMAIFALLLTITFIGFQNFTPISNGDLDPGFSIKCAHQKGSKPSESCKQKNPNFSAPGSGAHLDDVYMHMPRGSSGPHTNAATADSGGDVSCEVLKQAYDYCKPSEGSHYFSQLIVELVTDDGKIIQDTCSDVVAAYPVGCSQK